MSHTNTIYNDEEKKIQLKINLAKLSNFILLLNTIYYLNWFRTRKSEQNKIKVIIKMWSRRKHKLVVGLDSFMNTKKSVKLEILQNYFVKYTLRWCVYFIASSSSCVWNSDTNKAEKIAVKWHLRFSFLTFYFINSWFWVFLKSWNLQPYTHTHED